MGIPESVSCYLVRKSGKDRIDAGVERRPLAELPPGDVLIRVSHSSLNYKDALAATGHPGVARKFPHVPGIDCAGVVVQSGDSTIRAGDAVLVTGYELGAGRWGGWCDHVRVPAEWVVPLPAGLSPFEAMALGTAGFTAGLSIAALEHHGVASGGEIVVTGASGGVGSLAVAILAKLGYTVVAVSGKADRRDWLLGLGARDVAGRDAVSDDSGKALLAARWAGAIDTVGGNTLATIVRSTQIGGCVTACGLVGGAELPLTVYPFILRGVTLVGIDSAWTPRDRRLALWEKLAGRWRPASLAGLAETVPLAQIGERVERILRGEIAGRTVVELP